VEKQYGNIPQVECHPNRLNQVFMNLLVNASQAIPDQGTITIRTAKKGDSVKISISDTGVGIPPENLSRVFDPGFTTKGVGVGTGLGLSICYKIIEEHQGKIDVESSDKGTTFTITLPLGHGKKVKSG
jgi:two-component system NtrC family sensor kinase